MNITEQTLVIIKNETIRRGLVGRILQKFEDVGLKINGIKMVIPSIEQAEQHYTQDQSWEVSIGQRALAELDNDLQKSVFKTADPHKVGRMIWKWSVKQLANLPVMVIIFEGPDVVGKVKAIVGAGEPSKADLSTIRGSFSTDTILRSNVERRALYNVVHRSSSIEEANREIAVWFPENNS